VGLVTSWFGHFVVVSDIPMFGSTLEKSEIGVDKHTIEVADSIPDPSIALHRRSVANIKTRRTHQNAPTG
jgi:hypothetical protein